VAVDRKALFLPVPRQLVNARSGVLFQQRQRLHDRIDDAGVDRLAVGGKNRGDVAAAAGKIFVRFQRRVSSGRSLAANL
jgi:hypothetical protein